MRKNAFTLAEVLITLGIIGVVAVLTIPALVANYQVKSWNTAASNFEVKFGEALRVMNTQQSLSNLKTTEKFVEELSNHIKIVKTCDKTELEDCFTNEINGSRSVININKSYTYDNDASKPTQTRKLVSSALIGQEKWGTNTMGLMFADGVSAILAYNPDCSANPYDANAVMISGTKDKMVFSSDCVAMVYDTSGFASPNEKGKDIRVTSMASIDDGSCAFKSGNTCWGDFFVPTPIVWKACVGSGTSDNPDDLKIMKELGITHCSNPTYGARDYWAGAVKHCKEQGKELPTVEDWIDVARFVHNDDSIPTNRGVSGLTYDAEKAALIGFSLGHHWSSVETGFNAVSIYMDGTKTHWHPYRQNSGFSACVSH